MTFLNRFVPPVLVALAFITGLFWLLHFLISGGHGSLQKGENLPTIDFVRLNKQFEVETRERTPPKMPDKPQEAPETPTTQMQTSAPLANSVDLGQMKVSKDVALGGFNLSSSDGEYLPIVKVSPIYPSRAQSQGIEGWVLLKFTVTETGSVRDAEVMEAQPPGIFEEAAKKAVLKFKYKPRVENGRPVAVAGVEHLITFKIDKK
jgi:protein TonB